MLDRHEAVAIAAVAGGGWLAWWITQKAGPGVYAPVDLGAALAPPQPAADSLYPTGGLSTYLGALSAAEDPSGDPYAKNPYSSASGLYQFVKKTWTGLGGDWGPDPSQAFGGLTPSPAEQTARAAQLTAANAAALAADGVTVDAAALYAAHIIGSPWTTARVLQANPDSRLTAYLAPSTVAKNPALGSTVASFLSYLARKVGG